jgi:hypothetical protein
MTQGLNRATRRAQVKAQRYSTARVPRPVTPDTMRLATARATTSTADEIESVMAPTRAAFKALREGVATEQQWAILAGGVSVAIRVEHHGAAVRGYGGHLKAAEDALQGIYLRAMATGAWRPTALYWQEIDALDEFVSLHKFQLEHLSNAEIRDATDKVASTIRSQRGEVVDLRGRQHQAQLQLDGATV